MCLDGLGEVVEGGPVLLATGLDDCQHRFDKTAAVIALCAKRKLAPNDTVTKGPLAAVVRGFDPVVFHVGPEPLAMIVQLLAHADQPRVATKHAAQQQGVDLGPDRYHQALESHAGDSPVAITSPERKHLPRRPHQIVAQTLHLLVLVVDQGLKVAFQMSPAPLQSAALPVHFRPIAIHDPCKRRGQQIVQDRRGPGRTQGKDREGLGHERPQPGFRTLLFRGRLVDTQLFLRRQLRRQFLIGRTDRSRGLCLHLHGQRRATRLVQQTFQEHRRATFALAEVGHQQCGEGHQSWSRLTDRHAGREFPAGRRPATGTGEPVPLVLRDQRLDLRQFPHLMPQRFGIVAQQLDSASTTGGGPEQHYVLALVRRKQRPLVFRVPRLAATLLPGSRLPRGLCMRMLCTGRQRRVLRRLSTFQLGDAPCEPLQFLPQRANDRLRRRRETGQLFFREIERHTHGVAEIIGRDQISFSKIC